MSFWREKQQAEQDLLSFKSRNETDFFSLLSLLLLFCRLTKPTRPVSSNQLEMFVNREVRNSNFIRPSNDDVGWIIECLFPSLACLRWYQLATIVIHRKFSSSIRMKLALLLLLPIIALVHGKNNRHGDSFRSTSFFSRWSARTCFTQWRTDINLIQRTKNQRSTCFGCSTIEMRRWISQRSFWTWRCSMLQSRFQWHRCSSRTKLFARLRSIRSRFF